MNKQIVIPVLIALCLPVVYFFYLEGFNPDDLREVPTEFISQTQNIIKVVAPVETSTESEEVLDFLESLPEVTDQHEEQVIVQTDPFVEYDVIFDVTWSNETHSGFFPDGAHVSPFVVWTHTGGNRIFKLGEKASPGIEKMAELGGTITLEQEIDTHKGSAIGSYDVGGRVDVPATVEGTLRVSKEYPTATFVSMIAPSPDWFVMLQDIALVVDDEFIEEIQVPVALYDAGTEDGSLFTSKNPATDPQDVIASLTDIPVEVLPAFGLVTFRKK